MPHYYSSPTKKSIICASLRNLAPSADSGATSGSGPDRSGPKKANAKSNRRRTARLHGILALFLTTLFFQTISCQTAEASQEAGTSVFSTNQEQTPSPHALPSKPPGAAAAPSGAHDPILPENMSAWSMFKNADWVVKAVMLVLVSASILTWTITIAKGWALSRFSRRCESQLSALQEVHSLQQANELDITASGVAGQLLAAVTDELKQQSAAAHGIKERVGIRLARVETQVARQLVRGTGPLASIGATSPFIGLFGTVWGIMNAFIGISQARTTNLAVVAPGIAEALLATALGLVAAIPAVLVYNLFTRQIASARALVTDQSAVLQTLLSRDLDRHPPANLRNGQ